jgi:hypothetical protein
VRWIDEIDVLGDWTPSEDFRISDGVRPYDDDELAELGGKESACQTSTDQHTFS